MGPTGMFDMTKVSIPEALRECSDWNPVRWRTRNVRDKLYARGGSSSIRGLFVLPDLFGNKLEKVEEEEHEMTDTPDLACIIEDGMTVEERKHQLHYVTDENGDVILEKDGKPIPRPGYETRNFAISGDYHIGLDLDTGLHWRESQVIDYIIERELEQGLISNEGSSTNKRTKAVSTAKHQREISKMGKKVVRRGAGKKTSKKTSKRGGGSGESKTIRPRRSASKKRGKKSAARASEETAPEVDLSEIEGTVAELKEAVAELKENGGGGGEGDGAALDITTNLFGILTDTFTNLRDSFQETLDVMEQLQEEFDIPVAEEGDEEEEGNEEEEEEEE